LSILCPTLSLHDALPICLPPRLYQELALRLALELSSLDCRRLIVFLDDYHEIGQSVIHRTLASLIDHLPAELSLVIGSRTEPPIDRKSTRLNSSHVKISY